MIGDEAPAPHGSAAASSLQEQTAPTPPAKGRPDRPVRQGGRRPRGPVRTLPPGPAGRRPQGRDLRPPQTRARRRPWGTVVVSSVLLLSAAVFALVLMMQTWTGAHQSPLARRILQIDLVGGIVPVVVYILAAVAILAVLARRRERRWVLAAAIGAVVGAAAAIGLVVYFNANVTFGVALDGVTTVWAAVVFAAVGICLATLWRSAPWRKLLAAVCIVLVVAAGYVGINADFGIDQKVADVVGISTAPRLTLPVVTPTPSAPATLLDGGAVWANWHAPAGMPTHGSQSQVVIPNTISNFSARPAGLYLPPAALTANPPALPLVIMMMGQPGIPDPSFNAVVLDTFAAQHQGLAPIVLVADQTGGLANDPLCLDTTKFGKARTYVLEDVVAWARSHLHVLQDAAHWTIAGYSNGGECALSLGVQDPQIWGNVLDISGEAFPGASRAAATLAADFGGNQAAYNAVKPLNQLSGRSYPDTTAVFTVGSNDSIYRPQAKQVFAATTAAGWKTTYFEVPNGGHGHAAVLDGLQEGYTVLYPRLGLSGP